MRLLQAHQRATEEFDSRIRTVRSGQWDSSTPCTQWSVRDLVNHIVSEQLWVPWLLEGATLEKVGDRFDGDVLGDDPVAAWQQASQRAREAWLAPEATDREVHVTGGIITAEDYGWQMTLDLAVHAWDLARGIDAEDTLHAGLVETLRKTFAPHINQWQGLGIFAPPEPVTADADGQTKLLAMLGRRR